MMPEQTRDVRPWQRTVTTITKNEAASFSVQQTEYLDMDAASARLWDAMRERPDAGVSAWLDVALNGWGDDALGAA
jgi:hypothetical protein